MRKKTTVPQYGTQLHKFWEFLCLLISFPSLLPNSDHYSELCIYYSFPSLIVFSNYPYIPKQYVVSISLNGILLCELFCYLIMLSYIALVDSVLYSCELIHRIAKLYLSTILSLELFPLSWYLLLLFCFSLVYYKSKNVFCTLLFIHMCKKFSNV